MLNTPEASIGAASAIFGGAVMTAWAAVHLLATGSALVLIALSLTRGGRSPLRRPLTLLAASQFAWNAAAVGAEVTKHHTYALLGALAAPLFTPLALHFVLTFLGKKRQLKWLLRAAYAVFGAQSLLVLLDLLLAAWEFPGGLRSYALLLLLSSLPLAAFAIIQVVLHLRTASSDLERLRSRILLIALLLVVFLLITDPLADLGLPLPRLATLGSFSFNGLMAHLTLGLGLFTGAPRRGVAVGLWVVLCLFFAVCALILSSAMAAQQGVLAIAIAAVILVLAILGWLFFSSQSATRAGLERAATLGRFSAQMAHDLKNPLAAAKGAAEYLTEELRRSGAGPQQEFAQLVVDQLDRLHAVIDRYQRLAKLEPQLSRLDANQLVVRVLSLTRFAAQGEVSITTELASPAPLIQADADLLASALENLVKNALEAMPRGGTLTVRTATWADDEQSRLLLSVQDTGLGFDARARERAFELFFTTKASGSGLGLAFVREVARAHGGEASLTSREGVGTTVTLQLPLVAAEYRSNGIMA